MQANNSGIISLQIACVSRLAIEANGSGCAEEMVVASLLRIWMNNIEDVDEEWHDAEKKANVYIYP